MTGVTRLVTKIEQETATLRRCYAGTLRQVVAGEVRVEITVAPDGRVTDVRITDDSTNVPNLAESVAARITGLRLPAPERPMVFEHVLHIV